MHLWRASSPGAFVCQVPKCPSFVRILHAGHTLKDGGHPADRAVTCTWFQHSFWPRVLTCLSSIRGRGHNHVTTSRQLEVIEDGSTSWHPGGQLTNRLPIDQGLCRVWLTVCSPHNNRHVPAFL